MFLFCQNNLRGFSLYNPIYLTKQKDFSGQGKIYGWARRNFSLGREK
jgi:hypothetical protein